MKVKLVALTQPLILVEDRPLTTEEFIVYCARVSSPANQTNVETAPKLLRYCIRNKHWSVFEQASMTVEITTSRAISAQVIRHRSFTFQEYSQRYAEVVTNEPVELRKQGETNRQGGEEVFNPDIVMPDGSVRDAMSATDIAIDFCQHVYKEQIKAGVAKECARMVLPMCSTTVLYMTGTVRSWIHYLEPRCDPHTQKEHRLVADEVLQIFKHQFPQTSMAIWS